MNSRLLERRTQFLSRMCKGAPLKETVRQFAEDYGVTEKTLYNDWERREEWLPQIMQLHDTSLTMQAVQGFREVLRHAWLMVKTTQNDSVKIAALKLAQETYRELLDFTSQLKKAALPEQPESIFDDDFWSMKDALDSLKEKAAEAKAKKRGGD